MSDEFFRHASVLWPIAARILGWRPDEFWSATPAELVGALAPSAHIDQPLDRETLKSMMELDNG